MRLNSVALNGAVLGAFVYATISMQGSPSSAQTESTGYAHQVHNLQSSETVVRTGSTGHVEVTAYMAGVEARAVTTETNSGVALNIRLDTSTPSYAIATSKTPPTIYDGDSFSVSNLIFSGIARLQGVEAVARTTSSDAKVVVTVSPTSNKEVYWTNPLGGTALNTHALGASGKVQNSRDSNVGLTRSENATVVVTAKLKGAAKAVATSGSGSILVTRSLIGITACCTSSSSGIIRERSLAADGNNVLMVSEYARGVIVPAYETIMVVTG